MVMVMRSERAGSFESVDEVVNALASLPLFAMRINTSNSGVKILLTRQECKELERAASTVEMIQKVEPPSDDDSADGVADYLRSLIVLYGSPDPIADEAVSEAK